ncbi:MAG TPA: ATP-binding cassette domain-containing protein [Planctomicrobium sp.]|nr:ATP-binding cassette domain-containing protein [Planctomicrobium sp.]
MHFELTLSATYQFLPKVNTTRSSIVMDQFGIGFEQGEHCIAQDVPMSLSSGEIALFTGESGSGKSSLLRAARQQLSAQGQNVLSLDDLHWDDGSLVDLLPGEISQSLSLLTMCGLGEAQLMLRSPQELSDGQRYRFHLAYALAQKPDWIVADEFTATLDRRLARVISSNLRRLASKSGTGFLLATTHEDIVDDVQADQHLKCHLNGQIEQTSSPSTDRKKKEHALPTNAGSLQGPNRTGRTSLGGITGVTTSG